MHLTGNTIDDLLRRVLRALLRKGTVVDPTRGKTRELFGVLLELGDPRARVSHTESRERTLFSCLGELLWYLKGSDDLRFITHYIDEYRKESDDGERVKGAYGPRLFGSESRQVDAIIRLLRRKQSSRRAVISIYRSTDNTDPEQTEVPCTCTLQFVVRGAKLHMLTSMRSNDAYKGLPHDVFSFTMLQELVAADLGIGLGSYRHVVGSLHLYEDDVAKARRYLKEGWQPSLSMPHMPSGAPWPSVNRLLAVEQDLREADSLLRQAVGTEPYWEDLERLLRIYDHFTKRQPAQILKLKPHMNSRFYDHYIDNKAATAAKPRQKAVAKQCKLPFPTVESS